MVYSIWCITRNNILGEKGARSVFFFSGIVGSKGSELGLEWFDLHAKSSAYYIVFIPYKYISYVHLQKSSDPA